MCLYSVFNVKIKAHSPPQHLSSLESAKYPNLESLTLGIQNRHINEG